jgi:SSS family solute:Na+ symporter
MDHMPLALQIAFFGALLSAIMSTASATCWRRRPPLSRTSCATCAGHERRQTLKAMRISVLVFTICVLAYAITMQGTSIYELVSGAYQVPLVGRLRAAGVRAVLEARHHPGRGEAL